MDNKICIAKKVSHNNVEFLDFGTDENSKLIVFENFKSASEFLKENVGTGEALLDYIITTVEAQSNNARMQEALRNGVVKYDSSTGTTESVMVNANQEEAKVEEIECMFVLECDNFEIYNNQVVYDKLRNRTLVPVLAFVDQSDPSRPAEVPNFKLKNVFVDKFSE
jgi:hypothetical protein